MKLIGLLVIVVGIVTACTKPNHDTCCTSSADCEAFGLPEIQPCPTGLTCAGHLCVAPTCSSDGCPATAPICDTTLDTCGGCEDSADCMRFPSTEVCNPATGACVACLTSAECGNAAPVCDTNSCRACKLDAECPSGACGDDGACVSEQGIVYLAVSGQDVAPCTQAKPCRTLAFGSVQLSPLRTHIIFGQGSHEAPSIVRFDRSSTTAPSVTIHGGGATLTGGGSDGFIVAYIPITIRDLDIVNPDPNVGAPVGIAATSLLERVRLRGAVGIYLSAQLTLRDSFIDATVKGIRNNGGNLKVERTVIRGGTIGIDSPSGVAEITNVLVHGASGIGLDLGMTNASVAFSTIADNGRGAPDTPSVRCTLFSNITIRSSIIWTPTNPLRPGIDGCQQIATSIIGPMQVGSSMNSNPSFVNPQAGDFHLNPNSVARDLVNDGPTTDFEGDPRPRGLRFDIGVDETP